MTATEQALLERARQYDAQALTEIYDLYSSAIYRYLYRYVGDAHLAEDLTSDVFVKLLDSLGTRRGPKDQLLGWLYRVAHNLAMDCFRKQSRRNDLPLFEEIVADTEWLPSQVEQMQAGQQVRQAIRQLTPEQQRVIVLRFGEGLKLKEIGALLGKNEGAVKLLQFRALNRLKKLLGQEEKKHAQQKSRPVAPGSGNGGAGRSGRGTYHLLDPHSQASFSACRNGATATQPFAARPAAIPGRGSAEEREI